MYHQDLVVQWMNPWFFEDILSSWTGRSVIRSRVRVQSGAGVLHRSGETQELQTQNEDGRQLSSPRTIRER